MSDVQLNLTSMPPPLRRRVVVVTVVVVVVVVAAVASSPCRRRVPWRRMTSFRDVERVRTFKIEIKTKTKANTVASRPSRTVCHSRDCSSFRDDIAPPPRARSHTAAYCSLRCFLVSSATHSYAFRRRDSPSGAWLRV